MTDRFSPPQSATEFPEEAFSCPHCGQMLAPSCRVCVACRQPIEARQIVLPALPQGEPACRREMGASPSPVERARFSWGILLAVLGIWLLAAAVCQVALGNVKAQVVLGSVVLISSLWVFHDAQSKGVAKPFRWGIGSLLLWIVVFPWYLSRRRTPKAPCPFIEAEAGPVARALLLALVALFLLSAVLLFLNGPKPH